MYSDNTVIAKYMHKIAILPKLLGKNLQTCHMQFLMKIIRTKNFCVWKTLSFMYAIDILYA